MNVFEDLVIELREENLLESVVINRASDDGRDRSSNINEREPSDGSVPSDDPSEISSISAENSHEEKADTAAPIAHDLNESEEPVTYSDGTPLREGQEFFKKKAVGEVAALQMVEHVITGVEREYLKVVPRTFDDFNAKKALNSFLNSDQNVDSEEHALAEFNLMQETESWCTALAVRDKEIPVSALRQYCERARPALSAQAMLALGRFYRNLPYSEEVRAKFDFVVTRLFSRSAGEKRVSLFTRDEMLNHINTLYRDWSSIPLYDAEDDESKVLLTALSFEDLAIEAENASSFDVLIQTDFFGRMRMFKESISELFYAPHVTAAAIESNIRIGNRYVELIDHEREKMDAESVHLKYAEHEGAVSDVTGKTLQLSDLLKDLLPAARNEPDQNAPADDGKDKDKYAKGPAGDAKDKSSDEGFLARVRGAASSVSKWYLVFAVVMISASAGLYGWANLAAEEKISSLGVRSLQFEDPSLKDYVKTAKISGENLYVQTHPSWDVLPKEKRQETLQKIFQAAQDNGCVQVSLIGSNGKNAGYASANRIEVVMP